MAQSPVIPTFGGSRVQVKVQDQAVLNTIEAVWNSVSGPSLEAFLEGSAYPFLDEQIVNRFAVEGDAKSGNWPALSEATLRIKENMPLAVDAEQMNVRTGDFFDFIVHEHDITQGSFSAELNLPGNNGDDLLATKLQHIQQGATNNPLGGADTPPRPVLAVDETDLEGLLIRLSEHIISSVALGSGADFLTVSSGRGQNFSSNEVSL